MNTESSSIRTTDVGSFPLDADIEKYLKGAHHLETGDGSIDTEEAQYFITKHNEEFKRKAAAATDLENARGEMSPGRCLCFSWGNRNDTRASPNDSKDENRKRVPGL